MKFEKLVPNVFYHDMADAVGPLRIARGLPKDMTRECPQNRIIIKEGLLQEIEQQKEKYSLH